MKGDIAFQSSDAELVKAWQWAKASALGYVREGDPAGPWYEAALPGRDAFCMRDVAHQSMGAAALGLTGHTKNMLYKFAENISESKDWCSYWEINKDNLPAPVDYLNDKDFWYNLPANFDVMDACFRMFHRTGDSSFIQDSVFLNFYEKSVTAYVDRWDLDPSNILMRNRLMNLPAGAGPENHRYYWNRGIPGYYEGGTGRLKLGIDLLAAQYAAYNWYHYLLAESAGIQSDYLQKAMAVAFLADNVFWNAAQNTFGSILYEEGLHESDDASQDFSYYLLHYKAIDDTARIKGLLDKYAVKMKEYPIEMASHLPEIFFRYGRPEDGIAMIKHLSDSSTSRREYPENPFALVSAFVHGLMGVDIHAPERFVSTLSGFKHVADWGEAENIPLGVGSFDLLHHGRHTSVLRNNTGDTLYWQAYMKAGPEFWYINDEAVPYEGDSMKWYGCTLISWITAIPPGETVKISAVMPKMPEQGF